MTLVTRDDANEPTSKHTIYERCSSARSVLYVITTESGVNCGKQLYPRVIVTMDRF